jgi:hypothetical protein
VAVIIFVPAEKAQDVRWGEVVRPERSKGEEAWGEKVGNYNRVKYVFGTY